MSASAPWHRPVARRPGSGGRRIATMRSTRSSTCSRRWSPARSRISATGCAGQHGDADIKPAPAPGTPKGRPPGKHEDHELRLESSAPTLGLQPSRSTPTRSGASSNGTTLPAPSTASASGPSSNRPATASGSPLAGPRPAAVGSPSATRSRWRSHRKGPQRHDLAEDVAAALGPTRTLGVLRLARQFYRGAYLRWIDATKRRPEQRAERIAEMVKLLRSGIKEPRSIRPSFTSSTAERSRSPAGVYCAP
jgi:hypothetical protein